MKVPIEWLKELVNFRAGADQLAQMLTMAGLETQALPEDVLEVETLPNRADCLSVRGVAREVSALTKFKLRPTRYRLKESFKRAKEQVRVEVRDKDLCPRYLARVIERVKVGESPEWLKKRLERAGIRSINNVVDATNYLLQELGQPLHAFDAKLVKEQKIIVRRANPEEKVITLDGKERVLNQETLVIADPEKVIAIAGVMGALNSEVSPATTTIILESAYFNPVAIHKAARFLKLRSEAAIHFEHGVDWETVGEALDRGAALIAELGRGEVPKGQVEVIAKPRQAKILELRPTRVNHLLGGEIPIGEMISILKRLGFTVKQGDRHKLKVTVPLYRAMDIEREIDLIEELARIWGYQRIEAVMPAVNYPGKEADQAERLRNEVADILLGCGLTEVQTYSLVGPKEFSQTGQSPELAVKITNPLNLEGSLLRSQLLPGLLNVAVYNQNRQEENVFIFELGKVFSRSPEVLPQENWRVAGLLMGSPFMSALDKGEADYYYLKGIVENLFQALGKRSPVIKEAANYWLQPGKGGEIEGIGLLGELHPDIVRNYELNKSVFFFELDLDRLIRQTGSERKYRVLPKFPFVARDISMFVPPGLTNQVIGETIHQAGGDWVEAVFPFDRYKDSLAYRVIYRHPERTLNEIEVNGRHNAVLQALSEKLQVRIRM